MKKAWVARKARGDYYKFTAEDQEKSRQASIGRPWSEKERTLLMSTRKTGGRQNGEQPKPKDSLNKN